MPLDFVLTLDSSTCYPKSAPDSECPRQMVATAVVVVRWLFRHDSKIVRMNGGCFKYYV